MCKALGKQRRQFEKQVLPVPGGPDSSAARCIFSSFASSWFGLRYVCCHLLSQSFSRVTSALLPMICSMLLGFHLSTQRASAVDGAGLGRGGRGLGAGAAGLEGATAGLDAEPAAAPPLPGRVFIISNRPSGGIPSVHAHNNSKRSCESKQANA